jgi:hypothetical protein
VDAPRKSKVNLRLAPERLGFVLAECEIERVEARHHIGRATVGG